jgi:Flp pilus assembly protein TadG
MTAGPGRSRLRRVLQGQKGQTAIIFVLSAVFLIGLLGLGVDGVNGFFTANSASRAAEAGVLAGVIFMPNDVNCNSANPSGSGNDAKDRVWAEAQRNGFWSGSRSGGGDTCTAVTAPSGHETDTVVIALTSNPNQLSVTVSRTVPVFFLQVLGVGAYTISRTAVAEFEPPIALGQPGNQQGSTVASLDTAPFFMRTEGWNVDRGQGDAFTPNPDNQAGVGFSPPLSDVHLMSRANGAEVTDTSLSSRGGYNYQIFVPANASGVHVQVYNAAFSPEFGNPNYCDNFPPGGGTRLCNTGHGNLHFHEDDCCGLSQADATTYSAMQYTLFSVDNTFIRSQDAELSRLRVLPIDASQWSNGSGVYKDVVHGNCTINQNSNGSNMQIYHEWIDVANYLGPTDKCAGQPGLVTRTNPPSAATTVTLGAGTYRLRIDTLDYQGNIPTLANANSGAHKGLAVRVVDSSGTGCSGVVSGNTTPCTMGPWEDASIYTPIDGASGNTGCGTGCFSLPLFQLPKVYAGRHISVDLFDVGDLGLNGTVDIAIAAPGTTTPFIASSPVCIFNIGLDRRANIQSLPTCGGAIQACSSTVVMPVSNPQDAGIPCQVGNLGGNAKLVAYRATEIVAGNKRQLANNYWYRIEIPVPSNYDPCPNPLVPATCTDGFWHLQYITTGTAGDTITYAVGLQGSPVRLLPGF